MYVRQASTSLVTRHVMFFTCLYMYMCERVSMYMCHGTVCGGED